MWDALVRYGLTAALLAFACVGTAVTKANAAAYTFTSFNVPGAPYTAAQGINDLGQVTGYFQSDAVGDTSSFVDTKGTFTTFDVTGAIGGTTLAYGINDAGQVTGSYDDATGHHGFAGTPTGATAVPEPASTALLAVGLGGLGLITRRRRTA